MLNTPSISAARIINKWFVKVFFVCPEHRSATTTDTVSPFLEIIEAVNSSPRQLFLDSPKTPNRLHHKQRDSSVHYPTVGPQSPPHYYTSPRFLTHHSPSKSDETLHASSHVLETPSVQISLVHLALVGSAVMARSHWRSEKAVTPVLRLLSFDVAVL